MVSQVVPVGPLDESAGPFLAGLDEETRPGVMKPVPPRRCTEAARNSPTRAPAMPVATPAPAPAAYDPPAGESIPQAAANALVIAASRRAVVTFRLAGTPAEAAPGETPGVIALRWY